LVKIRQTAAGLPTPRYLGSPALPGLGPEHQTDAFDQRDRRLRAALGPYDLLQLPLELRPVETRAAPVEVSLQGSVPLGLELTMQVVLDVPKDVVAISP
jgi:hypothetical protein